MIAPDQWRPVGGLTLEPNALAAASATDTNVVVAAGPGAGKTELLAQRADFLLRTGACRYPRRVLAISFKVDAARNLGDRVRERSGPQYAARFDSFTFHAFAKKLVDNFRPVLTGNHALEPGYRIDRTRRIPHRQITFDDLVPLAREILAHNAFARNALRQTYPFIFLDEFQDATAAQFALVKDAFLGTDAQLTAVGDVKQRIMAWAGALDGIMEIFATEFTAQRLPLYQNYRAAPRLRRMQNRMIADIDPDAASPDAALAGVGGAIHTLSFPTAVDEAEHLAEMISVWLDGDVPPHEIAVLVRQQSRAVTEALTVRLQDLGIAHRDEQESQDLAAEPAAALVFNFLRSVTSSGDPDAYSELMRVAARPAGTEEAERRHDSKLKRLIRDARAVIAEPSFDRADAAAFRQLVVAFLKLVSRPVLNALSPAYEHGGRLNEVVGDAFAAFAAELAIDGDPIAALARLSDLHAVRVLTIHKAKGLEFEKVIILGVEEDLFWADDADEAFFVAISRAKTELVLTWAEFRAAPELPVKHWHEERTAHARFLAYADDDDAAITTTLTAALDGGAGAALRAELRTQLIGGGVRRYRPEAPIDSHIDTATICAVTDIGAMKLVEVVGSSDTTGDCAVKLDADVTADVQWAANAPTPFDADAFAPLAINTESEAPILTAFDSSAPLKIQFTADFDDTAGWHNIELDTVELDPDEQTRRSAQLTASEALLPDREPPDLDT